MLRAQFQSLVREPKFYKLGSTAKKKKKAKKQSKTYISGRIYAVDKPNVSLPWASCWKSPAYGA